MAKTRILEIIAESISVKQTILQDEVLMEAIWQAYEACLSAFKGGNKVLFCGNGGSAADAQHLAAELSGRFYLDREPLFAEALHVNTSYLTAVANDHSFEEAYARLVRAYGSRGDVLVSITTSGNSPNIINAMNEAKNLGLTNIAFTGKTGGKAASLADILINIPSTDTPRIQECHIMVGHIVCELVEKGVFG